MRSLAILVACLVVRSVALVVKYVQPPCDWRCQLCGRGAIACCPNNATFDTLPINQRVKYYRGSDWTSFITRDTSSFSSDENQFPHIHSRSPPNTARLPAHRIGGLTLGPPGIAGHLVAFHYGCTTPSTNELSGIPIPCNISFTGTCFRVPDLTPTVYPPITIKYPVAEAKNGTLAYYNGLESGLLQNSPDFCHNYTISATSALGTPVDAYLDEVLFRYFASCAT